MSNLESRHPFGERHRRSFRQRNPRHPAEVTSDRLGDHYERYWDRLDGQERDAISAVRNALERIAQEDGR